VASCQIAKWKTTARGTKAKRLKISPKLVSRNGALSTKTAVLTMSSHFTPLGKLPDEKKEF